MGPCTVTHMGNVVHPSPPVAAITIPLVLVVCCAVLASNWMAERKSGLKSLPGPFSVPFLGCLHLLAAKKIPFAAFTDMIEVGRFSSTVEDLDKFLKGFGSGSSCSC